MRSAILFTLGLSALSALSGCGMIEVMDATKSMPNRMDTMINGMNDTNESVRLQTLDAALKGLFNPENTKYLLPPTGMLAFGELFGKKATVDEMITVTYVYLKEVEKSQPDEFDRNDDGKFSEPTKKRVDRDKLAKLMGLQVIAGLAPQDKVDQIIARQVPKGRYEKTTYEFLMLRAIFLRDVLIQPLLKEKITNSGMYEEAFKRISAYDSLARLDFVGQVALKTGKEAGDGFLNPDLNVDEKFDVELAKKLWSDLENAYDKELEIRYRGEVQGLRTRALDLARRWN